MIVRIMGRGQYKVDNSLIDKLNAIDDRIVGHVTEGDQDGFRNDLHGLISAVKDQGEPLDPAHIVQSDVIVPPEDLTFEEARKIFSGEELIKEKI